MAAPRRTTSASFCRHFSARPEDAALGLLLGLGNIVTNVFLLAALRQLLSAVMFSVSSAGRSCQSNAPAATASTTLPALSAIAGALPATVAVILLTVLRTQLLPIGREP